MKATIVLIADNNAENYGRKLMLEAHKYGKMGFEMARLPQHVSLKQPFSIPNLEDMEEFFNEFAKELSPFDIEFVQLDVCPSNVLGGTPSGCMSLRVKETVQLLEAQKKLNEGLNEKFGPCPAEHDDDYIFHMTFAIGGAPFESYCKAHEELTKKDYNQIFRFNKIGLLYYDDDNITPGTYFCYKVCDI
ncbi:MAG: 2'-5' RNA ligase family protein [Ruminococcus sp.]|nr:2'-5' RNA ligase family protein [Ruminococcus sp.]